MAISGSTMEVRPVLCSCISFVPKPEISSNAKPVDAACVFRAAEGSTCRLAGALRPRERTW
jgi:hypothetical protein